MFIIRADGNAKIGAGHLMRCLTIGEALRRRMTAQCALQGQAVRDAEEILFLCADEESAEFAKRHGFRASVLHTDYRRPEEEIGLWDARIQDMENRIHSGVQNCIQNRILVDSYYVTDDYLAELRKYGEVFLMDDLQRHAYPVDGIVNYNLFAEEMIYRRLYEGRDVRFFLGGKFVPVRSQFQNVPYRVKDAVRDVLITTGGGDADNLAGAVLDVIYRQDITYHVLVGRFSPHFENWRERASVTENLRIHYDVQDMAKLMCECDLAVSAGGSTLYELAAVGVPFICFSYAENQEALVEYIGQTRSAGCAGAWHRDAAETKERMRILFGQLCDSFLLRQQYSERERRLIDGRGADRLAEALCGGRS